MKKTYIVALALLSIIPVQLKAENTESPSDPVETTITKEETDAMIKRVQEIKAMDKSKLTRPEKVQLRKELHSIKQKLDDGVYISAGALLVVIIILLIVLI